MFGSYGHGVIGVSWNRTMQQTTSSGAKQVFSISGRVSEVKSHPMQVITVSGGIHFYIDTIRNMEFEICEDQTCDHDSLLA